MGSKSRMPPSYLRRPLPGQGMVHPEPFGSGICPPPGAFPFEMLPPPEIMEQKLAAQHLEMERLVNENQRLAATHGTLRKELAAAQHEIQMVQARTGAIKAEREQQMRNLTDKISNMEAELKAAETAKLELQQARADAQNLGAVRQELISKVQQLTQELQVAHADLQQMPALISELESLRKEFQHCRATYDYEKKSYNDHLESLQVMEKNYITMAREMEKLRAELSNSASVERRSGGPYGGTTGYNENEPSGHHPSRQNAYDDDYAVPQGRSLMPGMNGGVPGAGATAYAGAQSGLASARSGYDGQRGGPGYDLQRGHAYDAQRGGGAGYDIQRGSGGYDTQRGGQIYDAQRNHGFEGQRGQQAYDVQRGVGQGYDMQKGPAYDAQPRAGGGASGQVAPTGNVPYGSATPPARGGNPGRR